MGLELGIGTKRVGGGADPGVGQEVNKRKMVPPPRPTSVNVPSSRRCSEDN